MTIAIVDACNWQPGTECDPRVVARLREIVDPAPTGPPFAPPGTVLNAVLILADPAQPGVPILLIRRSRLVSSHRGQIAFPGGAVDPGDDGLVETALREAEEEVGVPRDAVEVIGVLSPLETRLTGRPVTPVVGLLRGHADIRGDGWEVGEHFWLTLTDLLVASITRRRFPGTARQVCFIDIGERVVWGATAAMLNDLRDRLLDGHPTAPSEAGISAADAA